MSSIEEYKRGDDYLLSVLTCENNSNILNQILSNIKESKKLYSVYNLVSTKLILPINDVYLIRTRISDKVSTTYQITLHKDDRGYLILKETKQHNQETKIYELSKYLLTVRQNDDFTNIQEFRLRHVVLMKYLLILSTGTPIKSRGLVIDE